jgi:hypothetical protein
VYEYSVIYSNTEKNATKEETNPIAKRSNVPQLADQDIEANEIAQAILAAQYRWQAKQRDLEAKFCTDSTIGRTLKKTFSSRI